MSIETDKCLLEAMNDVHAIEEATDENGEAIDHVLGSDDEDYEDLSEEEIDAMMDSLMKD